jgi:RimJ/RimL family protein N-acetyltransferase
MFGEAVTARLRLHPWSAAFDAGFAAMNSDPEVMRYLTGAVPMTTDESRALSERFAAHWDEHGFGLWAAELAATGEFIGFVGLQHPGWFPDRADEVEVGWRLARAAWGHGYATEAAEAALEAAFTTLDLSRVISLIDAANTRSGAVARRLGLTLDEVVPHPRDAGDLAVYAMTAPAWASARVRGNRRSAGA